MDGHACQRKMAKQGCALLCAAARRADLLDAAALLEGTAGELVGPMLPGRRGAVLLVAASLALLRTASVRGATLSCAAAGAAAPGAPPLVTRSRILRIAKKGLSGLSSNALAGSSSLVPTEYGK